MEIGYKLFVLAIILTVSLSSVSAKGKCRVCDSSDPKCLKEPNSITTEAECEKCFTLIENNGNIKRGCVSDSDKCDGKNCKSCTAINTHCNVDTDLFWCKSCESSATADCAYWQNENSIPNEICDSGVNKCLMEIKSDKHTSRRCATKNDETTCVNTDCKICSDGNSCNKGIYPSDRRQCFQCKSDNSKCATPSKFTSDILSYPCLFYEKTDKCFEYGSSDTAMSRGCHSDTTAYDLCSKESPKEKCKECEANGCNVDEYKLVPNVKCIQCQPDDPKCAGAHTAEDAKDCSSKIEYWKPQGCYTNKPESGKVARGCIQDFDCASASGTCTSCTNGNACNNAIQTGSSCYKCRSDDNPKCGQPLEKESFTSDLCRNEMTSNDGYQCYIEKWNDIVIRSCLADADPKTRKNCLDTNYKLCEPCKGDNCNMGAVPNSAQNIALTSGLFALSLLLVKFV